MAKYMKYLKKPFTELKLVLSLLETFFFPQTLMKNQLKMHNHMWKRRKSW